MCGICGVYRFDQTPVQHAQLKKMNDQMRVRGPDDEGFFVNGSFGMAMRRLSIIDLSGGHQPISNEEEDIFVVLNGEIYNYIELRQELEARGHRFKTHSDVEVLVHLYEEEGTEAIKQLNGMFAFSLWDQKKQQLWIGRDRLGIKPLVYSHSSGLFAFGSTLDTLAQLPELTLEIDPLSFFHYLQLAYVPTPRTIYRDVHKLPPGHYLTVKDGKVEQTRYWDYPQSKRIVEPGEWLQEVRFLLEQSIEFRSRSDVPVGCMLSGGLDSSSVTALFSKRSQKAVHTFSMDFEGKTDSELVYAAEVSSRYQTQHHPYLLGSDQAFDDLGELLPLMDEPMADSAIVPSYFISKMARDEGIKVILCGAGGDELFGGYRRHFPSRRSHIAGSLAAIPWPIWNLAGRALPASYRLLTLLGDRGIPFGLETSGVSLDVLAQLLPDKDLFQTSVQELSQRFTSITETEGTLGFHYARMKTDMQQYLLDNVLAIQDKTTMAASIEGRVPLLDHRIVESVYSVAESVNIGGDFRHSKQSLKTVVKNDLPASIFTRKKVGFNAPTYYWVCQSKTQEIRAEILENRDDFLSQWVDLDVVKKLFDDPKALKRAHETVFALYLFSKWRQHHG